MKDSEARQALVDAAAGWASGLVNASVVVEAATDALIVGLESPHLARLAGCTRREADVEIHDLLPAAMEELDLPYFGWDHPDSRLLAATRLAREHLDRRLPARDLCRIIHSRFGHDAHDFIEPLAALDDDYDTLQYSRDLTEEQLDRRTFDAASQLLTQAEQLYRDGPQPEAPT